MDTDVKLNKTVYSLKKALDICQPGDIIEGASVDIFDDMLIYLEKSRNKTYNYFTDRRYGEWRFILTGKRN